MKVFIDTNIFIDVFSSNTLFLDDSSAVLRLCDKGVINGVTTASAITDIYYILHKYLHDNDKTYAALGHILNMVHILPVTEEDILMAFSRHAADFEDCLQAVTARRNSCSFIVSRDSKGFEGFGMEVLSPAELIRIASA